MCGPGSAEPITPAELAELGRLADAGTQRGFVNLIWPHRAQLCWPHLV
jgi:hypothetical protein